MAVLKLSQIASAGSPPALTDTVIGVGGGTTDLQYTLTQIKSTVSGLTVGTTTITSGTTGDIVYDNGGVVGESTLTALIDSNFGSAQGDILYRGASAWVVLTPGTSGNFLKTQGAAANPTWAAVSAGAGGSTTQVQYNSTGSLAGDASFTYAGNGAVTIGTSGHTGSIALTETGGNAVTITPTSATGAWTFKLPTSAGTNTYVLTTDGSGNSSWTAPGSTANLVVGTSTITSGTTTHVVYDNAGVVGEAANFTIVSGNPNVTSGNAYYYNSAFFAATDSNNGVYLGPLAGNFGTVSGDSNISIGLSSGAALTSGARNVMIGKWCGGFNASIGITTQNNCVAIGFAAGVGGLPDNTVAVGAGALSRGTTGNPVTGTDNTAIGTNSLSLCSSGQDNVGLGLNTLQALTTGSQNVAIGTLALGSVVSSGNNVAVGYQALQSATGQQNLAIGTSAGAGLTTGTVNLLFGFTAGSSIQTGSGNIVIGSVAGTSAMANCIIFANGAGNELDYNFTNAGFWTLVSPPIVPSYAVASLPTGVVGAMAQVSDGAAVLVNGQTVTGGGTAKYLVWFNGADWKVVGI